MFSMQTLYDSPLSYTSFGANEPTTSRMALLLQWGSTDKAIMFPAYI
jgi:hypothetical protein